MQDFGQLRWNLPPSKKAMAFIDGENLVCRYQEMIKRGRKPHPVNSHLKDVYVWQQGFTFLLSHSYEILRVFYYASLTGNDEKFDDIKDEISKLEFSMHQASLLPNNVFPKVFKKEKSRQSKGVDISMTVDVLSNVYKKNIDALLLITGDGDFYPLVEESMRHGVTVYLSAFSSGLNENLRRGVDRYLCLDGMAFLNDE